MKCEPHTCRLQSRYSEPLQRAELDDLKSVGAFRVGPNSVEGKYFWTTREDAAWFARHLSTRYGEGPSWIVEVLLAPSSAAEMEKHVADQRPIRYVDEDKLDWFNDVMTQLVLPTAAHQDGSDA